jgi:hypothetical protein
MAADAPSYRYPFHARPADVEAVAPAHWTGWSRYQGDEAVVQQALEELLREVGLQVGRHKRNGGA